MTSTPITPLTLRIGTRSSNLARWQAEWVANRLRSHHPGLNVELIEIRTQGDRDRNSPLAAIGGTGLFTKEIQRAVIDRKVDVAVHSLKDLPTQNPAELILAAVPRREDVADALIAPVHQTLQALPAGSRIGTSSLRRRAQLLYLRPDIEVTTIRGNVESRLNQALGGKLDAVILASAGLHRLSLHNHITQRLAPLDFLPAVGQGALGVECHVEDKITHSLLLPLDDAPTRRAILAERTALAELEGGCLVPVAAWARDIEVNVDLGNPGELALDAAVFDPDGRDRIAVALTGSREDPRELGVRVARALCAQGAKPLLERPR
jgi:hydroxymethylbilane synthase